MSKVTYTVFDNGLTYIKDETDMGGALVAVATKVGQEKEHRKDRHALHAWEHLAFRDGNLERTLAKHYSQFLHGIDGNGSTSDTDCTIRFTGPRRYSRELVYACYDALHAPISEEELAIELQRLAVELGVSTFDDNATLAVSLGMRELYKDTVYDHTGLDPLDTKKITSATIERLRERMFRANNLIVVSIGAKDIDTLVAETFGSLPYKRGVLEVPRIALPPREEMHLEFMREGINYCHVTHLYRCGEPTIENIALADFMAEVLGTSDVSPLHTDLCTRNGTVYTPEASPLLARPELLLRIKYDCNKENLAINKNTIEEIMAMLAMHKFSRQDFLTYRAHTITDHEDEMQDQNERLSWYIEASSLDRFVTPREYKDLLRSITPRMVQQAAQEWMEGLVTVTLHPTGRTFYRKQPESSAPQPLEPEQVGQHVPAVEAGNRDEVQYEQEPVDCPRVV